MIAAGSLAAAGALHVSFGTKAKPRSGTRAQAAEGGERRSPPSSTADSRRHTRRPYTGLPVNRCTLSPRALYVAAGIGDPSSRMAPRAASLVPTSRCRLSSVRPPLRRSLIAWAPDGFRIAYVVHAGHRTSCSMSSRGTGPRHGESTGTRGRELRPGGQTRWLSRTSVRGPRPSLRPRARVEPVDPRASSPDRASGLRSAWHSACTQYGELSPAGRKAPRGPLARPDQGVAWLGSQLVVSERPNQPWGAPGRLYTVNPRGATLLQKIRLPGPIFATHGRMLTGANHEAARRLARVASPGLRFRLKPCLARSPRTSARSRSATAT